MLLICVLCISHIQRRHGCDTNVVIRIAINFNASRHFAPLARRTLSHADAMSTAHLPPDVLQNLAQHIAEDVITGNYDFGRQKIRVVSTVSFGFGSLSPTSLVWYALSRLVLIGILAVVIVGGLVYTHPEAVYARIDAWMRARVLKEASERTRCDVTVESIRARWNSVVIRGLVIGNPKKDGDDDADFKSPHLASFKEIKIAMHFLSAIGRVQRGNFIAGFMTTYIDEIFISGARVYVEDAGKRKNYQIMKPPPTTVTTTLTEKKDDVIADAPAEAATSTSFFGGLTSSLEATQKAFDAQIQEAMKLPGAIGESIQSVSSDLTKRMYALVAILDKLQRVRVLNDDEMSALSSDTIHRAPTVLRMQNLTLADWNLSILSVAETPFSFARWELNNFLGNPRELGKSVAVGLVQEIINDFHRKIFGGITNGVGAIGNGIFDAGSFVVGGAVGGVTTVGSGLVSGVTTVGSGLVGGVATVGGGLVGGVTTVGSGLVSGVTTVGSGLVGGITNAGQALASSTSFK